MHRTAPEAASIALRIGPDKGVQGLFSNYNDFIGLAKGHAG